MLKNLFTISIVYIFFSVSLITACEFGKLPSHDGTWDELLPNCPCQNPDYNGLELEDGWAKDRGDINEYHKGATECFRSYPYTTTGAGNSGQQCCYDHQGQLIVKGSGAGTPDKVSTVRGEDSDGYSMLRISGIWGHWVKDVIPWENAGNGDDNWEVYNERWKPNQGVGCN